MLPEGKVLPLNSKRLFAVYVRELAEELGLPTRTTTDEVRQLIEGDLTSKGREPKNVQIIVQEPAEDSADGEVCLYLVDEAGVIAKRVVSARKRPDSQSSNKESEGSNSSGGVVGGLREEIATLKKQLEAKKHRADEAEALASERLSWQWLSVCERNWDRRRRNTSMCSG